MFTGIIQHVGRVVAAGPQGGGRRLLLDIGPLADGLEPGASLAVSGVCLTARRVRGAQAEFDAVSETVSRTTLARLRAGGRVNLERPLRLGDGLDGHLVQGHADGVAEVRSIDKVGQWLVRFGAPRELADGMVPKGSVAVDGVSLTLAEVFEGGGGSEGGFCVALIPETLARTTLGDLAPGTKVNIETDILGKYVRKHLASMAAPSGGGLTMEKLREAGYV